MAWTEEMVEGLRQMWVEGLTANEIAKRLGVSKNSIVGKVHRLCLKARPSPIKKKEQTNENVVEEKDNTSAAEPLLSDDAVAEENFDVQVASTPQKAKKKGNERNIKLVDLDSHTCRWPLGDPRDDDFCFCGKKVKIGQTYCDEHAVMAYVRANKK